MKKPAGGGLFDYFVAPVVAGFAVAVDFVVFVSFAFSVGTILTTGFFVANALNKITAKSVNAAIPNKLKNTRDVTEVTPPNIAPTIFQLNNPINKRFKPPIIKNANAVISNILKSFFLFM